MAYTVEHDPGLKLFFRFRRDPPEFLADTARRGVDVRHLRFGSRHIYQVNHPDLIRDVLITNDWNFIKGRALRASKPVLGEGLLTSEGELHRRQRRLAQPAFHSERLAGYAQRMVEYTNSLSQRWQSGMEYTIDTEMAQLTLQIVARTLFSADVTDDAAGVGQSLRKTLKAFELINRPIVQLSSVVRGYANRLARRSREGIEVVLLRIVDDHRQHPDRFDDMLSMLMGASDDGHPGLMGRPGLMSDELLMDEALTLFLAGHETTANALTWSFYLLAQHPEVVATLEHELATVLNGRLPTLADLPRLPYLEGVFNESLRLYPPAWIIVREAVTAYRLGNLDIPAHSTLLLSSYATHRDPRFWDRPEAFDPTRFEANNAATRHRFAFFPFGAGTRVCIGERFAMMEGMIILAILVQRWRLHLLPDQTIGLWPQITLRPSQSIRFRVQAR